MELRKTKNKSREISVKRHGKPRTSMAGRTVQEAIQIALSIVYLEGCDCRAFSTVFNGWESSILEGTASSGLHVSQIWQIQRKNTVFPENSTET